MTLIHRTQGRIKTLSQICIGIIIVGLVLFGGRAHSSQDFTNGDVPGATNPSFTSQALKIPHVFTGEVQDFTGSYEGKGFYYDADINDKRVRRPIPVTMRIVVKTQFNLFSWAWEAVDSKGKVLADNHQKNIGISGNELQVGKQAYHYGTIGSDGFIIWVHYDFVFGKRYLMDTSYGMQQVGDDYIFHSDIFDYLINKRVRVEAKLVKISDR